MTWAVVVGREAAVSRLRDNGRAPHARLFVEEGAKVVVGDDNGAESERLAAELTDDAYQRTVAVDEHGLFAGMRAVMPRMRAVGPGDRSSTSHRRPAIRMRPGPPTWPTPQPNARSGA
jgi:NAD(P)-dependent dehydrogenase (short-subunit alcohol dehydrogenase family)